MKQLFEVLQLNPEDFKWISGQIFTNECGGLDDNLVCWNENENFLSLGIGHFIWYPRDTKQVFTESFPKVLDHIAHAGYPVPEWLETIRAKGCPWNRREDFIGDLSGETVRRLREFLKATLNQQVEFIIRHARRTLEKISSILPESEQMDIIDKFNAVAHAPRGFYPLIDYINFKGCGNCCNERYQGRGWGLLQVLDAMEIPADRSQVKAAFAEAAIRVLERRVGNSPPERNEAKRLPGWKRRIMTYLD